jgi:hypothetical protein
MNFKITFQSKWFPFLIILFLLFGAYFSISSLLKGNTFSMFYLVLTSILFVLLYLKKGAFVVWFNIYNILGIATSLRKIIVIVNKYDLMENKSILMLIIATIFLLISCYFLWGVRKHSNYLEYLKIRLENEIQQKKSL